MGHRYNITVWHPLHRLTEAERTLLGGIEEAGLFEWRRDYYAEKLPYDELKTRIAQMCRRFDLDDRDPVDWIYRLAVDEFEGVRLLRALEIEEPTRRAFPTLGSGLFWERTPPALEWFLLFAGARRRDTRRLAGRVEELCTRYVKNMDELVENLCVCAARYHPNQPRWTELAPRESKAWRGLRRMLSSLRPHRHLHMMELIAGERGHRWFEDSVLEFDGHDVFSLADDDAGYRAMAERDFGQQAQAADLIEGTLRLNVNAMEALADVEAMGWERGSDEYVNDWLALVDNSDRPALKQYLMENP
jgi:hypothetical protein